jgi:hypothetical protein
MSKEAETKKPTHHVITVEDALHLKQIALELPTRIGIEILGILERGQGFIANPPAQEPNTIPMPPPAKAPAPKKR